MNRQTRCSVVIRSLNEEEHIGRLLVGIMEQTIKDVEIILVDSGSVDATVSIASQFPVKIISISPEEFSFGRSLNKGINASSGEYIIIVSAHVYPVYHDWIDKMLRPFEDTRIALVYGKQKGGESTRYSEHQVFAQWFGDVSISHQDNPFFNNANAAIRRVLWEEQHYDEELTGLEDIDWANHIISKGYHIAYQAEAEAVHLHNETSKTIFNRYRREAIAHKNIFPEQTFNLWDLFRLSTANILSDYYHAFHDKSLMVNILDIPQFRLLQFWGTYCGFAQREPVSRKLKQNFYYPRGFNRTNVRSSKIINGRKIEYEKGILKYLNE